MEKGGMEGGKEWCSLTWARRRPCPIMRASRRSQAVVSGAAIVVGGRSFLFLGVRFRRWPFVFVGGRSHSLVGVRGRWWASVFAGGESFSLVGVVCVGGRSLSLVGVRFRPWAFVFAGGGSSGLVVSRWWLGGSFRSWASAFVGGRSSPFGRGCLRWWPFVMWWLVGWLLGCVVVVIGDVALLFV